MKFTKINLSKFPFVRPYGDYQTYTDLEKWHRFIKNNEFYSYCNGLPVYSTLRRYFETGGDHGMTLTCERPPEYDHGYMYKRKGGKPILVYQPYGDPDNIEKHRNMIETWAKERHIQVKIFDYGVGWYYPARCYLVVMGLDLNDLKIEGE